MALKDYKGPGTFQALLSNMLEELCAECLFRLNLYIDVKTLFSISMSHLQAAMIRVLTDYIELSSLQTHVRWTDPWCPFSKYPPAAVEARKCTGAQLHRPAVASLLQQWAVDYEDPSLHANAGWPDRAWDSSNAKELPETQRSVHHSWNLFRCDKPLPATIIQLKWPTIFTAYAVGASQLWVMVLL